MHASIKAIVVDLVLSGHLREPLSLTDENRKHLCRHLTHVLVNEATRSHYKTFLLSLHSLSTQSNVAPRVVTEGLDGLTNGEIAILALDTDTLDSIANEIDATTPEPWIGPIRQEGIRPVKRK